MTISAVGKAGYAENNGAGATTLATGSRSWTAGNMAVVIAAANYASSKIISSVVGGGNTLTYLMRTPVTGGCIEIYAGVITSGGSFAFTATWGGDVQYRRIVGYEFSSDVGWDTTTFPHDSATNTGTSTSQPTGAVDTSVDNALLITAYSEWDSHSTYTEEAGYSVISEFDGIDWDDSASYYKILTSTVSAESMSMTVNSSGNQFINVIVAIAETVGGGPTPPAEGDPGTDTYRRRVQHLRRH